LIDDGTGQAGPDMTTPKRFEAGNAGEIPVGADPFEEAGPAPGPMQSRLSLLPLSEDDRRAVVNHLLFHKAILGHDEDGERLNRYMRLVEELGKGFYITVKDPFERSISIAFELTMLHHLDPWDIDLVRFSNAYLERMKQEKDIDLITAGRIIYMAWSVLKLQSDDVLFRAENDARAQPEEVFLADPEGDWYVDDAAFEFTHLMIQHRTESPIKELVWRKGKRPVTLLELVSAFEEAKHESEIQQTLAERRREMRRQNLLMRRALVGRNYHKEDLESDIRVVWERINKHNGHPIPLSVLTSGDLNDRITTLISTLFLAKSRRVDLWQERFPYGEIFVKNLAPNGLDAGPLVEGPLLAGYGGEGNGGNGGKGGNGGNGGNGGSGGNGGNGRNGGHGGNGGNGGPGGMAGARKAGKGRMSGGGAPGRGRRNGGGKDDETGDGPSPAGPGQVPPTAIEEDIGPRTAG